MTIYIMNLKNLLKKFSIKVLINKKTTLKWLDIYLAGVAGLEPTLTVLETVALPLNYTPI